MIEIIVVQSEAQLQQVRELSRGFIAWLVELDTSLGVYDPAVFEAYGYAGGEAQLPGEYVAPNGCLLLAVVDSRPAGCIALRRFSESTCEMRMLFVHREFQGLGLGRALVLGLLDEGRKMGYSSMCLDTSPHMVSAHRLYFDWLPGGSAVLRSPRQPEGHQSIHGEAASLKGGAAAVRLLVALRGFEPRSDG